MAKLYIVATPIGNLDDISKRALETLNNVDYILCEDTRISSKLLNHYNIKKKLISFFQQKERTAAEKFIITIKENNQNIALISDNGTPTISDPGYILIEKAYEHGVEVIPIPGPSAIITAISASGFSADKFYFLGFLPKKKGKKKSSLSNAKNTEGLIVIYESPFRVKETLNLIKDIFGNTNIFIGRELTKKFEEKIRGNIITILNKLSDKDIKGEIVIIIENYFKKERQNKNKYL